MLKLLLPDEALVAPLHGRSAESWRTSFITEYKSVGTCAVLRWKLLGLTGHARPAAAARRMRTLRRYYNDHSPCAAPANYSVVCGGPMPRGPADPTACVERACVGCGECYFVDSLETNSWRSLRVVNVTHDLTCAGAGMRALSWAGLRAQSELWQSRAAGPIGSPTVPTDLPSCMAVTWSTTQSSCSAEASPICR